MTPIRAGIETNQNKVMQQALPPPSPRLQELMAVECAKPAYAGMDEDDRAIAALRAVYAEHGEVSFDFTNPTDDILRQTLTGEGL